MKLLILCGISIVLFILDTSFMPLFNIHEAYPNLLTMYFLIYCMNSEKYEILGFALFTGFLQDVFFYNGFGFNIFLNLVLGTLLHYVSIKYNKNKFVISVLVISVFLVLKSFIIYFYLRIFFGIHRSFLILIYEFLYSLVIVVCVYPLVDKLFNSKFWKKSLEF